MLAISPAAPPSFPNEQDFAGLNYFFSLNANTIFPLSYFNFAL